MTGENTPLDVGLLQEVPGVEQTTPYAAPDPSELVQELEQAVAQQVITVRDEQSLNIANLAQDGVAHFLVNREGQELCGGCGQAFPCSTWRHDIETRNLAASSGQPEPDRDKVRTVADLLGVDLERARQIVLMATPLDEIK